MKIVLIYNPHSGSSLPPRELRKKCAEHNITIKKLIPIGDGFEKKVATAAHKPGIIAAIGGDGTLSSVAGIIMGTKSTFAPLSGGTLNHFTKDLGIPQDLDEALSRLTKAKVRRIDVACVNDTTFINNSSIGLYPSSLHIREHFEDRLGKWPAAVIGSLRALRQYHSYQVSVSGKEMTTPFIFIGNNDYHLDDPARSGRKHLDKGVLSVYTVDAASRWKLIKLLGWALVGRLKEAPEVKTWKAKEVTIQSKQKALRVSFDGEFRKLPSPLVYKIKPASLKVI